MKELDLRNSIKNLVDYIAPTVIEYNNIVINSKSVEKGDIFVGIKGKNNDGNEFYKEAYDKGAAAVIFDNRYFYSKAHLNKILVENSVEAIKSIGKWKLDKSLARKLAVIGSVGKTSTKSILYNIFSRQYQTYMSYKNYNNELGIAIACANIEEDTDYAIFELGTNSLGEISLYGDYLKPDLAIITKIGSSHLGKFGSVENIAKEKFSIGKIESVKEIWTLEGNKSLIPSDIKESVKIFYLGEDERSDAILQGIKNVANGFEFVLVIDNERYSFYLPHFYKHFVYNAALCAAVALREGIEYEFVFEGIKAFKPEEKRGEIVDLGSFFVINDTYNASLESIKEGVKSFYELGIEKKKFAIIGEIAEIDGFEDKIYGDLLDFCKKFADINFLFCGEYFSRFDDQDNLRFFKNKGILFKFLEKIDTGAFFVKASRSKRFEEIVDYFIKRGVKKDAV